MDGPMWGERERERDRGGKETPGGIVNCRALSETEEKHERERER